MKLFSSQCSNHHKKHSSCVLVIWKLPKCVIFFSFLANYAGDMSFNFPLQKKEQHVLYSRTHMFIFYFYFFFIQINGENVVRASHDRVVQVIRHSGDTLAMKVVTVQQQQTPVNWQHMDGTMTLPTRGSNSAASKKQGICSSTQAIYALWFSTQGYSHIWYGPFSNTEQYKFSWKMKFVQLLV